MRAVIGGKIYDTTTAQVVCDISPAGYSNSDFEWEDTALYKSPAGQFFIAGAGNARTRWAKEIGNSSTSGGSGVKLVSTDEACKLCETHGRVSDYIEAFGEPEAG